MRRIAPHVVLAVAVLLSPSASASAQRTAGRIAPPPQVTCPRDHLTVYIGTVTRYSRDARTTTLDIATDSDTNERVRIAHGNATTPLQWFLLRANRFDAANWKDIEVREGRLLPGMRAAAWVCDDGRNPVIDWMPPVTR